MVVQVDRLTHDDMVAHVTTDWGLDRQIFCHHLDFGFEFRTRAGEWIQESDPRVLRWLQRFVAEAKGGNSPRHLSDDGRELQLAAAVKLLRRNGVSCKEPRAE
ncbi:hypothetical protein OKA04_12420 [Luteolibacter flavescens]|uniref:Transposase n=1 Tax=Luteolibacter flavescens TaxID=1859460 RepID=A0ABT3FPN0_9BACT|nr:hypothetical protein [Luteolibacter flavescens]MCW1885536.1 hypothetical protein [Luteolibacter flavescens]